MRRGRLGPRGAGVDSFPLPFPLARVIVKPDGDADGDGDGDGGGGGGGGGGGEGVFAARGEDGRGALADISLCMGRKRRSLLGTTQVSNGKETICLPPSFSNQKMGGTRKQKKLTPSVYILLVFALNPSARRHGFLSPYSGPE